MKPVRKLALRREALAELDAGQLGSVAGGNAPNTLQYGANRVVWCLISTPTWCGAVCDVTDKCMGG